METFTEASRYNYDLNENSVVIDLGVYEGNFSNIIQKKYNCYVYGFEPVTTFYENVLEKIKGNSKIQLFNLGVGGSNRTEQISIRNDSSGIFLDSDTKQEIQIESITQVMEKLNLNFVDLIKINIEGSEYELLENMIENNIQSKFKDIQVQFHYLSPDCIDRRNKIREKLSETHYLTYDVEFIWENWRLK